MLPAFPTLLIKHAFWETSGGAQVSVFHWNSSIFAIKMYISFHYLNTDYTQGKKPFQYLFIFLIDIPHIHFGYDNNLIGDFKAQKPSPHQTRCYIQTKMPEIFRSPAFHFVLFRPFGAAVRSLPSDGITSRCWRWPTQFPEQPSLLPF